MRAALVTSIELLSIEAVALVLLTPVRLGQLIFKLGPVLLRLRRLVIACDSALVGYASAESQLVSNLSDFRTAIPSLANRVVALVADPNIAWARPRGVSFSAPAPANLGQIATRLRLLSNSGQPLVRIEQYRVGGQDRFIVYIPGTQNLGLAANANPFDMRSNLLLMAGGRSPAARATELALRRAGIGVDDRVMLVGHSQGGLIAIDLAKRSLAGDLPFRVEHAVTFGSPTGLNAAISLPNVVSFENKRDVVPKLELLENPSEKNWVTVEGNAHGNLIEAHRMEAYERIVATNSMLGENRDAISQLEGFTSGEARVRYFELGQR